MSDNPYLAHHFESIEQQTEAATMGMWLFLVTEVMFFGGLFAGYAVYRFSYPEAFLAISEEMSLLWGTVNTGLLLTSSFTMVLAVHYAKEGSRGKLLFSLLSTLALAGGFLVIKSIEYSAKYSHGFLIGKYFTYDGPMANEKHLILCLYYFMTGLHAIHIIIGMGIISWLAWLAWRGKIHSQYNIPVEMVGLYWHFVDLVWVYLFPLWYLVGLIK